MSLAYYCVYSFREAFFEYVLGLDNEVGWFGAAIAVATFCGGLFWAKSSDLTGDYKTQLILCTALACVSFYGMYFLEFDTRFTFYVSLFCFALNSFFLSAFQPLVDVLVLRIIYDKEAYGKQRLWLSITYGFISTVMSVLAHRIGWISVFPAMSLLNSIFIIFILLAVQNPPVIESLRRSRLAESTGQRQREQVPGFMALLRNKRFIYVMIIVFFLGAVCGIFTVFLSGNQKNVIKISPTAIAIVPLTGLSLEIPIFFWGKSIIRVLGVDYGLLLALFIGLVRIISYLVVAGISRSYPQHENTYGFLVCAIELLKGPCFALTHSAAIKIVMAETPEILHGRAQALYAGIYNNLSSLLSSLMGQTINSVYGPKDSMTPLEQDQHRFRAGNINFVLAACFTIIAIILGTARLILDRIKIAKNPPQPDEVVDESKPILEKDKAELFGKEQEQPKEGEGLK